jgi:predicted DNA-binding ribbon-helix-helix protein
MDRPELSPAPSGLFSGPVKHSITIAGHQTSISLEPVFWAALNRAAEEEGVPLNALVARIDEARIADIAKLSRQNSTKLPPPANLASALRLWLWERNCK